MSLRDTFKQHLNGLKAQAQRLSAKSPSLQSEQDPYAQMLKVSQADEMAYLKDQMHRRLTLVRAFDAELRETISSLHEPGEGEPIDFLQVRLIENLKVRCARVMGMEGLDAHIRHLPSTPFPVSQAIDVLALEQIKGEADNLLLQLRELHIVLQDFRLDNLPTNPLRVKGYRECLTKLVLTNLYGRDKLYELYPDDRPSLKQIREDMKRTLC